jgi:hypothetical protein
LDLSRKLAIDRGHGGKKANGGTNEDEGGQRREGARQRLCPGTALRQSREFQKGVVAFSAAPAAWIFS